MAGPIVAGPDGTRHRRTGIECIEEEHRHHGPFPPDCGATAPLPRIPGWPPALGPAPQYLSDDPWAQVREGDLLAVHVARLGTFAVANAKPSDWIDAGGIRGEFRGVLFDLSADDAHYVPEPTTCWLVARADPTEDA